MNKEKFKLKNQADRRLTHFKKENIGPRKEKRGRDGERALT